ncbi:MAG: hypothetical protein ACKV2O_24895 [Acidimicrobiales bacterium]
MSDLEARLRDAAHSITVPDPATFANAVLARQTKSTAPRRRRRQVGVAALVAAALLSLTPPAWALGRKVFGVGSVTIARDRAELSTTVPTSTAPLLTGTVTVPSPADLPLPDRLGPPTEVTIEGDQILARWPPGPSTPPTPADPAVGVLFSRLPGRVERQYFAKIVPDPDALRDVTVRGEPGVWIQGAHQFFVMQSGTVTLERVRLAANVLLWTEDGHTFRLELQGDLQEAQAIVASIP